MQCVEKTTIDYIKQMAESRIAFYSKHIRANDNEWILQEMEEWGDEVQIAAERSWKNRIITKADYQQIVDAARDGWTQLRVLIEAHEESEDFIGRLTGQI